MNNRTLLVEFAEAYYNYKKILNNPDSDWQDEEDARKLYEGLLNIITKTLDNYEDIVEGFSNFNNLANQYSTIHWDAQCLIYAAKQKQNS